MGGRQSNASGNAVGTNGAAAAPVRTEIAPPSAFAGPGRLSAVTPSSKGVSDAEASSSGQASLKRPDEKDQDASHLDSNAKAASNSFLDQEAARRKRAGTESATALDEVSKTEEKPLDNDDQGGLQNIELEVMELRASLTAQGLFRDSIEEICEEKRQRLIEEHQASMGFGASLASPMRRESDEESSDNLS